MDIRKRIFTVRILVLIVIFILARRVVFDFLMARHLLGASGPILTVGAKTLFLPVVCIIFFRMFWKVLKLAYIFLVLGLTLLYATIFEIYSLSLQTGKALQMMGLLLFIIAIVQFTVYFLSKRSNKFIEDSVGKWAGR